MLKKTKHPKPTKFVIPYGPSSVQQPLSSAHATAFPVWDSGAEAAAWVTAKSKVPGSMAHCFDPSEQLHAWRDAFKRDWTMINNVCLKKARQLHINFQISFGIWSQGFAKSFASEDKILRSK